MVAAGCGGSRELINCGILYSEIAEELRELLEQVRASRAYREERVQ